MRLPQAYDQHRMAEDPERIMMAKMEPPPVVFDQDFPIVTDSPGVFMVKNGVAP